LRILVYSYFPVLKDHQAGGAQFAMRQTIEGLAKEGLHITVICPEADGLEILAGERIRVLPILKEATGKTLMLHERARNLHHIAEAAQNVDVIWTLDSLFPLKVKQPIVLMLQTIAYEDELNSFWDFNWDVIVLASDYLAATAKTVAGAAFWKGTAPLMRTILNGIDTNFFAPANTSPLLEKLNLPPAKYILFPHRPEPEKGFDTALLVLKRLIDAGFDYKLLVPTNPHSIKSCLDKERRFYRRLFRTVQQSGLDSAVIFHPWITLDELPAYFSLGETCLMLSSLPEGFGFTPIQSISCETPVISTKSGALRGQFPPGHGVTYVETGEVEPIVSAILKPAPKSHARRGREYVKLKYSFDRYLKEYLDCFKNARKKTGRYEPNGIKKLLFAPWCYFINEQTVWHDLEMKRVVLTQAEKLIIKQITEQKDSFDSRKHKNEIEKLLRRGILTLSA